jgi:hypothetical protein
MPFIPDDKYQKMLQQMQASSYGNAPAQPGMNPFTAGPRTIMSPYQPQKSSPIPQPQIPWTAGMPGMQSPPQQRPAPQRTGQRPTPTPINPLNIPMPPRGIPTTADFAQGLALPGVDDSSSAYSDQLVAANGQMPAGGFQNDPAAAAYPGASGFQQGTGVARQPQAGEKATGDTAQAQGTEGAFGLGFNNMDWIRLGGSLLAGSQPGGGGWAAPTEALGQITGEKENKKRYDTEQKRQVEQDAMTKEMFGYDINARKAQEAEVTRTNQIRASTASAAQAMLGELKPDGDPNERRLLELAVRDPDKYSNVLEWQLSVAKDNKDYDRSVALTNLKGRLDANAAYAERVWKTTEAQKDRDTQLQVADFRRTDPTATVRGRADMARIQPWSEAANTAVAQTLPRIQRMREIMTELGKRNGVNRPIDADSRVTLAQWGLDDKVSQGLMQEFADLQRGFVLEEVQKLKPASNVDLAMVQKTLVGPNTEVAAATRMFDNMENELNRGVNYYNGMVNWMDKGWSIDGLNDKGQTLNQAMGPPPKPVSSTAALSPLASSTPPDTNAIWMLRQNPTAEKKKEWDEVFGHYAKADDVLNQLNGKGAASTTSTRSSTPPDAAAILGLRQNNTPANRKKWNDMYGDYMSADVALARLGY